VRERDSVPIRVLCLGNDLLADDAFGIVVAEQLRKRTAEGVDVVATVETGFGLMEYLLDVRHMVVVDTVMTGKAAPGTVYVVREQDVERCPGGSPHYIGLFEGLELGRKLDLDVPDDLVIVAVEGGDCRTVGGVMSQSMYDAIPIVLEQITAILHSFTQD
jgi:hydrogenase maturation protease